MSANSAQHALFYVPEVTYGVVPTNPAFVALPVMGCTLADAVSMLESNTMRPDRQMADSRHGSGQIGGEISAEFFWQRFDALLEAVLCGTWNSNLLKPGGTRRSFTFLRHFTDLTTGQKPFHLYPGTELNNLTLTITTESFVKLAFTCTGKGPISLADTAPTGTTYPAQTEQASFDGFTGDILVDDVSNGSITEITLTIENGMEQLFSLFNARPNRKAKIGRTRATGNINLFFDTHAMYSKFIAREHFALKFNVLNPDGHLYEFHMPRVLLTGGQPDVEGESNITLSLPFVTSFDATAGYAIQIERDPA